MVADLSYTPGLSAGESVAGVRPPLDGSGGEGWLSAIYLEQQQVSRSISEMTLLLAALVEMTQILDDIRLSLHELTKTKG